MPTETPTPATIAVTPGSGVTLDAVQVTVSSNSVIRECVVIADPANGTQYAEVNPKGTQADNFLGVQQAHDSGRTNLFLSIPGQTASSSTSPTAVSNMTQTSGFVSSTGVTAFQITAGTLRITNFGAVAASESTTTTTTSRWCMVVQIRVATTNTTTAIAAGVIVAQCDVPITLATAAGLVSGYAEVCYPDGIEIPYGNAAGNYVGVTFNISGTSETGILLAAHVQGFVY